MLSKDFSHVTYELGYCLLLLVNQAAVEGGYVKYTHTVCTLHVQYGDHVSYAVVWLQPHRPVLPTRNLSTMSQHIRQAQYTLSEYA